MSKMSKKDKIEKGTNIFSNLIKKSAKNKKLKKEQKVNDFFNNLPEDIQKRIENKEKNIIKKDRKTKEELSEARTNTIFGDPTVKSYERYLDLQLDRSITRKLKQNDIEIQADYKKMMDKIEDDYKKTSDTGKALTKARDERKLKDGGSVNKKKPVKKKAMKKSVKGTKWESKWG